jgi:mRNA interferase MazF
MTGYKRGSIVLLPFPFSDQSSAKIRPAVVASPDYPSDDLLVVAVTSVGDVLRPGEFPIQVLARGGIDSSIICKTGSCFGGKNSG